LSAVILSEPALDPNGEYRQRDLAAGVWFRLRRVLADARLAFAISEEDARRLIAEGCQPAACGAQVTPEKMIFFVGEPRLAALPSRRAIPVTLGPDFLAATAVALVAFDSRRRRVLRVDRIARVAVARAASSRGPGCRPTSRTRCTTRA
jgi:hypothetical protein